MTGRKVTRRASMRRKSMRSPSVSRSSGSKTPRSAVSEPFNSGNNSFSNSVEKLNGEESVNETVPVVGVKNNSSERLSYATAGDSAPETPASSTELLASELAAVKISDSKENLIKPESVKAASSENLEAVQVDSKENLAKFEEDKPVSEDENKSSTSVYKSTRSESTPRKSAEDLVTVALDDGEKDQEEATETEVAVEEATKEATEEATQIEANSTEAVPATEASAEGEVAPVVEDSESKSGEAEESTKDEARLEKASKCRCIIS